MTPKLITYVLSLSLKVRLALLDADPNSFGCLIPVGATSVTDCDVAPRLTQYERSLVTNDGAAWLPSNPLAIVEHAARLRYGSEWHATIASLACGKERHRAYIGAGWDERDMDADSAHEAAVRLLAEVVGG